MKNMKRIHKVVIKRMVDESPDTSWLGEYGRLSESDYAIDRQHSVDCPSQTYNKPALALDWLERIMVHIRNVKDAHCSSVKNRTDSEKASDMDVWTDYDDAEDVCIDAGERAEECNCDEHGDMERNQYRFFNPNHENYKGLPEDEIRKYCLQDYARMEALNNQEFCFIGIRAEADYTLTGRVMQEVTSGGLWGIESDSSPEYLKEIEDEQLSELREQLKAIGFSSRAISAAFKTIEREEN
jgi:hypothetical protein